MKEKTKKGKREEEKRRRKRDKKRRKMKEEEKMTRCFFVRSWVFFIIRICCSSVFRFTEKQLFI